MLPLVAGTIEAADRSYFCADSMDPSLNGGPFTPCSGLLQLHRIAFNEDVFAAIPKCILLFSEAETAVCFLRIDENS